MCTVFPLIFTTTGSTTTPGLTVGYTCIFSLRSKEMTLDEKVWSFIVVLFFNGHYLQDLK